MIKNFAIFKNEKATGNQPQYNMVGKDGEGNRLNLGSLWLKKHNGTKFYSGQMKTPFTKDDGTYYDGYVILSQKEYDNLKKGGQAELQDEPQESFNEDVPF